jgi:hypothetical protein
MASLYQFNRASADSRVVAISSTGSLPPQAASAAQIAASGANRSAEVRERFFM